MTDFGQRPMLLDLFCGEGGAAVGYHRAGFHVVGVDLHQRLAKRYPFGFHAGDALVFLTAHSELFDAFHASPPCQHASAGTRAQDRSKYPRLIEPVRELLQATGKPYVIENVRGADLREPVWLCGTEFGLTAIDDDGTPLELWRHRGFESNVEIVGGSGCDHHAYSTQVAGSYGGARRDKDEARNVRHGGYVPSKAVQERLLGIDWMTQAALYQSIPPVYTEHIGKQLIGYVQPAHSGATP